jgi:hypothetical protein
MKNKYFIKAFVLLLFTNSSIFALPEKKPLGDVIIQWNTIAIKASKKAKQYTNFTTRTLAIESIAVYDAVNSISHIGKPYHYLGKTTIEASTEAAAARAAHDVLVKYFPIQKLGLDSALVISLQGVTEGQVAEGERIGAAAAADILSMREIDGSLPDIPYQAPNNPGLGSYRATPGLFALGIGQQWGRIRPFLILSGNQFRPVPPPELTSATYKNDLDLVAEIGSVSSTKRSLDQTHIAQFYKQDAELTVNEITRLLAQQRGSTIEETALTFMLVDIAEADACIASFESNYYFLFWRPVTALNTEIDGSISKGYAKFSPLVSTPPYPSYCCGHCSMVSAGLEVLKKFYGNDNIIEIHSNTRGEPSRVIKSLSEVESENGQSSLYGGINFPFDIRVADEQGHKLAQYILKTWYAN